MPASAPSNLLIELFALQCALTFGLTGLIAFVQIVHYPLFAEAGSGPALRRFEELHARRTGWVVFVPMVAELALALAWLYPPLRVGFVPRGVAVLLAALVGTIWASTGLVQVPLHETLGRPLARAEELHAMRRLTGTNWIRTAAWSLRSAILLWLLVSGLAARS